MNNIMVCVYAYMYIYIYIYTRKDILTENAVIFQNGKHTLSIQLGDKKFMLACPESTPEEPRLPPEFVGNVADLPSDVAEHSPESQQQFVWTPPFYLAPPLYPHPTYHKYSHPDRLDPSTSSSTPAPTFGPRSFPSDGSLSEHQDYFLYPDSLNEHFAHESRSSAGDTESSGQVLGGQQAPLLGIFEQHMVRHGPSTRFQVESPSLVPPTHTFNQYHHPNIPLPAPQYAAPAPVAGSPLFSVVPHPGAAGQLITDQELHSQPAHTTQGHTAAPHAQYPAQPHSDHQWYHFPQFTDGPEMTPFDPEPSVKNASSHQSSVESKSDIDPYWRRHEPLSDKDVKSPGLNAGEVSPPEQMAFPTNIPSPPFYHHPQHDYQVYYGPELSPSGVFQLSLNNKPQLKTFRPQSPSSLTEHMYDVHHIPPYYDQPGPSPNDTEVPQEGTITPKSESPVPSDSDHDFLVWLAQSSVAGNPNVPQTNSSYNIYTYDASEGYPDVEAPDKLLDNEIEGRCFFCFFLNKMKPNLVACKCPC